MTNKQDKTRQDKTSEATSRTRAPSGALIEMPPRWTYNERRVRVHLMKKRAHVHARACNVHVVPINFLIMFSYPKFGCLTFFYNKS